MQQISRFRFTAFTVSELLRENQEEGGVKLLYHPLPPTHTHTRTHPD